MASVSGLRISVPGALFSRNVGQVAYPVTAGLQALFYLGESEALTVANRAPARPNASMSRAPQAYFDGYVRFKGLLSYLQTDTLDTANDLTLISVVRSLVEPGPIISNYDTTGGSTELAFGATGRLNGVVSNNVGQGNVTADIGTAGRWAFAAVVVSGVSLSLTVSDAQGVLTTKAGANFDRTQNIGVPFRVGAGYGADQPFFSQDISVAAIHSAALTADQLDQVYKYLKTRLAKQGIAV